MGKEQWVIAANVKPAGTKRFVPGAKVAVYPGLWGDGGERVYVYGRHRGGGRYISLVMPLKHLENFRPALYAGNLRGGYGYPKFDTKEECAAEAERWGKIARINELPPAQRTPEVYAAAGI